MSGEMTVHMPVTPRTVMLKQKGREVKQFAGKSHNKAVMGGELDPRFKTMWALVLMFLASLNQVLLAKFCKDLIK
jgi:hypothetical protein